MKLHWCSKIVISAVLLTGIQNCTPFKTRSYSGRAGVDYSKHQSFMSQAVQPMPPLSDSNLPFYINQKLTCDFAPGIPPVTDSHTFAGSAASLRVSINRDLGGIPSKVEIINNARPDKPLNIVHADGSPDVSWQTTTAGRPTNDPNRLVVHNQAAGSSWGASGVYENDPRGLRQVDWSPLFSDHMIDLGAGTPDIRTSPCAGNSYQSLYGQTQFLNQPRANGAAGIAYQQTLLALHPQTWKHWEDEQAFYMTRISAAYGDLRIYLVNLPSGSDPGWAEGPIRPYTDFVVQHRQVEMVVNSVDFNQDFMATKAFTMPFNYAVMVWNVAGQDIGMAISRDDISQKYTAYINANKRTPQSCINANDENCGQVDWHATLTHGYTYYSDNQDRVFAAGQEIATKLNYTVGTLEQLAQLGFHIPKNEDSAFRPTTFGPYGWIMSLTRGACLTKSEGSDQLALIDCKTPDPGLDAQHWRFLQREDGYYQIHVKSTDGCIGVAGGSDADGAGYTHNYCDDNPMVLFRRETLWGVVNGQQTYLLKNLKSGKCIDVSSDGQLLQAKCDTGKLSQRFHLPDPSTKIIPGAQAAAPIVSPAPTPTPSPVVTPAPAPTPAPVSAPQGWLSAAHSGKCIDLPAHELGVAIHQWDCHVPGADNQQWRWVAKDNGYYEIHNLMTDGCLEVSEGSQNNGAKIIHGYCGGNGAVLFKPEPQGNGTFRLRNQQSQKCIDVVNGGFDNSVQLQQWDCNPGQGNQSFHLPDGL